MSNQLRTIVKTHKNHIERKREIKLRKHLNDNALFFTVKTDFNKIADHRPGDSTCPWRHSDGWICDVFTQRSLSALP